MYEVWLLENSAKYGTLTLRMLRFPSVLAPTMSPLLSKPSCKLTY